MRAPGQLSAQNVRKKQCQESALHQHQRSYTEASPVPFCCREAPCSLPSESRTCSVPWSPAAVTWFPSRQYRSTGPSAQTVYSHDTRCKSKVYPVDRRARVRGESMMERSWSWWRGGGGGGDGRAAPLCVSLSLSCLIWALRLRSASTPSDLVKLAATKHTTSSRAFQNKTVLMQIRKII